MGKETNLLNKYFTNAQIKNQAKLMHNEIHKLLLYKDNKINDLIFDSSEDFMQYFSNIILRYCGLNVLMGQPEQMIAFISTLQAAFNETKRDDFRYNVFRRLIFDAHGYLTQMFGEVR